MHTMLENLDRFIELLTLSQSVHVKDWDILCVRRGFEWGSYFQQVYHRFCANDCLRNALEDHLRSKNQKLSTCIKNYQYISFNDLRHSKDIFCTSLLQNKALSRNIFQYIVTKLKNQSSGETNTCNMSNIMCQKAASALLLFPSSIDSKNPLENPCAVTEAEILKNHLEYRIHSLKEDHQFAVVSDVLSGIPQPSIYNLLAILLLSSETCDSQDQLSLSHLLLKWLLENDSVWTDFCSKIHSHLLSHLSSKYSIVRKAYFNFLIKLGESMELDVQGKWVSNSAELSFDIFLNHFESLMKTSEDLQTATEATLEDLKRQDGDYNVPGISVWTDVLLEVKRI
ncbi:FA complementation group F L homeolog [Xenopus laevis]|nr:FA complementation group F L homeolog [Xenopus laevis]AAT28741.1 Fanconi anemia protein [Xenopus laevis]